MCSLADGILPLVVGDESPIPKRVRAALTDASSAKICALVTDIDHKAGADGM